MKKQGFTLAEVLVTLMIIGVIASMTIPALKRNADEQANVASVQKAYSTISSATRILRTEYGPTKLWNLSAANVASMYRSKMNALDNNTPKYSKTYLNGTAYDNANMYNPKTSFYTPDGMLYYVQSTNTTCSGSSDNWANGCINWGVDINGANPPNKVGIDIFGMYVTPQDVFPEGGGPGTKIADCNSTGAGWSCSAKIIQEGKITW